MDPYNKSESFKESADGGIRIGLPAEVSEFLVNTLESHDEQRDREGVESRKRTE